MTRLHALLLAPIAMLMCSASLTAVAQTAPAKAVKAPAPSGTHVRGKTTRKSSAAPVSKVAKLTVADATPEQVEAAGQVFYGLYECEFKQTVNIDKSTEHPAYVDVRHAKSQWLMKPVISSTGAIRLEDVRGETLMVQISSKSMLLNVKTAHRVVDDCVSARQRELVEEAKATKAAALQASAAEPAKPADAASMPTDTVAAPAAVPPK